MNRRPGVALALFALVSLIHALCPATTSNDSRWTVHLALSIMHRGDVTLDEYLPELRENAFYAVARANGSYHSTYPPGGPVLSIPLVFAMEQAVAAAGPALTGLARPPSLISSFMAGWCSRFGERSSRGAVRGRLCSAMPPR